MEVVLASFITVQSVDGREVVINSDQITNMASAIEGEPNKLVVDKALCVVSLASGKFISVAEPCEEILRRLLEADKPK
jgi:uncharacterized protein YlzI (FlbEa/FlbD family)